MMSSLSALLVSAYINNLIKFSASFHNYYRGYYVANAWLELALVKTNGNVRGYGFEDTVAASSTTVTNNFSGANISFTTTTRTSSWSLWDLNTSNPNVTTSCSAENVVEMWYEIPPGWCVPIILLHDYSGIADSYEWLEGRVMEISDNQLLQLSNPKPNITLYWDNAVTALLTRVDANFDFDKWWSMFLSGEVISSWQINLLGQFNDPSAGPGDQVPGDTDRLILMIANTDPTTTWHYCLNSDIPIPTQYVTIDAQGTYSNVTLDLKWVRKAWLPADFCYTAISS